MPQALRGEVWSALRIPLHDLGTSVYRGVDEKIIALFSRVNLWTPGITTDFEHCAANPIFY